VTRYLLDTNVISETARQKPSAKVIEWIRGLPTLLLPSLALYELAAGIQRMAPGRRRQFLEAWLADLLESDCDVVAFDRDAALASADLVLIARQQRRVVEHRDLLMLGIAKARSLCVATRNVSHFRGLSVPIFDPFEGIRVR
jgi:toxin FitB